MSLDISNNSYSLLVNDSSNNIINSIDDMIDNYIDELSSSLLASTSDFSNNFLFGSGYSNMEETMEYEEIQRNNLFELSRNVINPIYRPHNIRNRIRNRRSLSTIDELFGNNSSMRNTTIRFPNRNRRRIFNNRILTYGDHQQRFRNLFNNPISRRNVEEVIEETLNTEKMYKKVISDEGKKSIKILKFNDDINSQRCPITLMTFEKDQDIAILPCKHVFDKNAIMEWLENEQSKCPICRYEFNSQEIKNTNNNTNNDRNNNTNNDRNNNISNNSNVSRFNVGRFNVGRFNVNDISNNNVINSRDISNTTLNLFESFLRGNSNRLRRRVRSNSPRQFENNENDIMLQYAIMNSLQNDISNNENHHDADLYSSNEDIFNEETTDEETIDEEMDDFIIENSDDNITTEENDFFNTLFELTENTNNEINNNFNSFVDNVFQDISNINVQFNNFLDISYNFSISPVTYVMPNLSEEKMDISSSEEDIDDYLDNIDYNSIDDEEII
jgi:hypothetical protein